MIDLFFAFLSGYNGYFQFFRFIAFLLHFCTEHQILR